MSTAVPSRMESAWAENWAWDWCPHIERLQEAQQGPQERHWIEFKLRQMCAIRSSVLLDYLEKGMQGQVGSLQVASW